MIEADADSVIGNDITNNLSESPIVATTIACVLLFYCIITFFVARNRRFITNKVGTKIDKFKC